MWFLFYIAWHFVFGFTALYLVKKIRQSLGMQPLATEWKWLIVLTGSVGFFTCLFIYIIVRFLGFKPKQ